MISGGPKSSFLEDHLARLTGAFSAGDELTGCNRLCHNQVYNYPTRGTRFIFVISFCMPPCKTSYDASVRLGKYKDDFHRKVLKENCFRRVVPCDGFSGKCGLSLNFAGRVCLSNRQTSPVYLGLAYLGRHSVAYKPCPNRGCNGSVLNRFNVE